jgi:hypothetical protein
MDEPRGPAATLPMIPTPPRSRRRWLLIAGVPVVLVAGLLAARGLLVERVVRWRAAALGVDLDFDDLELDGGGVRLSRVRASLDGVRGLRVTAGTVRLGTSWLSVTSVAAEGVSVAVEGPASDRILDLASWSSEHADTYRLPGTASGVRVEWRAREGTPAWLTMGGGSLTTDGKSARFLAATTSAFGVSMGAVGASFAVDAAGVTIEAGKKAGGEAPLTANLRTASGSQSSPELSVTLRPVELSALGSALGLSLPARGAIASGRADLTLGRAPGGASGTASLELDGWVPPHPQALDGLVFGRKTTLRSRLRVSEDRATVRLDEIELHAGRLALKGSGTIAEEGSHAMVRLELSGPIACAELVRAVAKEELGVLGSLAGDMAQRVVGGTTVVSVSVEADARDLGAAKVTPKVGVGCAVKLPGL